MSEAVTLPSAETVMSDAVKKDQAQSLAIRHQRQSIARWLIMISGLAMIIANIVFIAVAGTDTSVANIAVQHLQRHVNWSLADVWQPIIIAVGVVWIVVAAIFFVAIPWLIGPESKHWRWLAPTILGISVPMLYISFFAMQLTYLFIFSGILIGSALAIYWTWFPIKKKVKKHKE